MGRSLCLSLGIILCCIFACALAYLGLGPYRQLEEASRHPHHWWWWTTDDPFENHPEDQEDQRFILRLAMAACALFIPVIAAITACIVCKKPLVNNKNNDVENVPLQVVAVPTPSAPSGCSTTPIPACGGISYPHLPPPAFPIRNLEMSPAPRSHRSHHRIIAASVGPVAGRPRTPPPAYSEATSEPSAPVWNASGVSMKYER